jgi:parallel beta-helix repeat protein
MANGITQFCCRSGGSNLNAGTLRGDSTEPGTSASFTYASGDWDAGTGVFTVASGDPSSDGVAVGDYVSVYADGSTVTGFVGQVSAVSSTDITVDLTDHYAGTAPSTDSGNRTLKVGGAWQGPNGAEGFPFDFVTATMCDGSDPIVRVNVKNDQTYSITSTITLSSLLEYCVFQGYQTTYADKNQALIQGPASGTSFVLFNLPHNTKSGNGLIDLHFDRNGDAAGANWGVLWGSGNSRNKVIRCRFSNMHTAGANFYRTEAIIQDCEFDNNGTYGAWHTNNGVYFYLNCRFHNNGSHGLYMTGGQNRYARAFGCIFANNGSYGASTAADSGSHYLNCIFYGNTHSGLYLSASQGSIVQNCAFIDNGAYGIYFTTTNQDYSFVQVYNCAFGSGTMANNSGNIRNGTGTSYDEVGTITEESDFDPYVSAATGDFTLKAGSRLARGGFNFTQPNTSFDGTVSNFPIGASGPPAPAGSGASTPHPLRSTR